jgi:hypothetical protein
MEAFSVRVNEMKRAGFGVLVVGVVVATISVSAENVFAADAQSGSFEDLLAGADAAGDLAELIAPLFADCPQDDTLAARQCASVRDWMIERERGRTFWAVGDASALSLAPYDAAEKKLELEVHGCLACGRPLTVDGKPRFFTTRIPKAIKAGHAVGLEVGFQDLAQPDSKAAGEFVKQEAPRLRVQFVFRVGSTWKSGTGPVFEGVAFAPVGYRIFDRCSGKVIASEPPTQDPKSTLPAVELARHEPGAPICPEQLSEEERRKREWAALPEQLSPQQINASLQPAKGRVHDCYAEFEVAGTANVKLVVKQDGTIESISLTAPFDKTPSGYCIRTAIKGSVFPKFRGEKMNIDYPFQLP